jgi:hypothetical protein
MHYLYDVDLRSGGKEKKDILYNKINNNGYEKHN